MQGCSMQHAINKAHTHAGNHKRGSMRHNQGRSRASKAADVQVFGGANTLEGGR